MPTPRAIGIDVGGTKILAGVVERDGTVVRTTRHDTPTESADAFLRGLADVVEELRDDSVAAVGLGIPSTIDQREGKVVFSVHVPLADIALRDRARDHLGIPVAIDNDANAAAVAEWTSGAGRGTSDMIMLTLGTGIGGGLILGDRLYRGWIGAGAELGHMVLEFDGPRCIGRCTGRGHFERFVSGTAAEEAAREMLGANAGSRDLLDAARGGNDKALAVLVEMGRRLGAGMASLVNIFNPELIVIGGGFAVALEFLLEPALEVMARDGLPPARDLVRVVPAALGEEAGMIGAALIGFEALDES